jgi:dynein heavy chain
MSRVLENAIQFGLQFYLKNVKEEIDPIPNTILQKETFKSGGATCIRFGAVVGVFTKLRTLYNY